MKILKKPLYLGLRFQMLEIQHQANRTLSYAERSRLTRIAAGKALVGDVVCGVRVGGKECVLPVSEANSLPDGAVINWTGRLTACDDDGVIAVE